MAQPLPQLPEDVHLKILSGTNLAGCLALESWEATKLFLDSDQAAMDMAVRLGSIPAIRMLRQHNIGVPNIDVAARYGHLHIVKYLTAMENELDGCKCTPDAMDNAAACGHFEILQWLHRYRSEGYTVKALLGSLVAGNPEIVEWIWEHQEGMSKLPAQWLDDAGSKVNKFEWLQQNVPVNIRKRKLTSDSISRSPYVEAMRYVLDRGWKLDSVIPKLAAARGQIGLLNFFKATKHLDPCKDYITGAVKRKQEGIVEWLTCHCSQGRYLNNAYADALILYHNFIARHLEDCGAEINEEAALLKVARLDGNWDLFLHVAGDDAYCVSDEMKFQLMKAAACSGGDRALREIVELVSTEDFGGRRATGTLVECAAANGNLKAVQYLKEDGWRHSRRAVESAAVNGHIAVLQYFYEEWWPFCRYEFTACCAWWMDAAAGNGHLAVVKFIFNSVVTAQGRLPAYLTKTSLANAQLVSVKVDSPSDESDWGESWRAEELSIAVEGALDRAAENGHMHVVRWLEGETGWQCSPATALLAASKGHLDIVRLIVRRNQTPGDLSAALKPTAEQHGHMHIVRWLDKWQTSG